MKRFVCTVSGTSLLTVTALVILITLSKVECSSGSKYVQQTTTNPTTRAEQTLQGLFHYYWKNDPLKKQIEFFFVCGQIGGWGKTHSEFECSCNYPSSCVNCYRWWDAVALESVATYGIYTKSKNYSKIADTIFAHSPYNANWNATAKCTFIDDFSWYGIAYLRVYEWLKVLYSLPCFYLKLYAEYFLFPLLGSYLAESFHCST